MRDHHPVAFKTLLFTQREAIRSTTGLDESLANINENDDDMNVCARVVFFFS